MDKFTEIFLITLMIATIIDLFRFFVFRRKTYIRHPEMEEISRMLTIAQEMNWNDLPPEKVLLAIDRYNEKIAPVR